MKKLLTLLLMMICLFITASSVVTVVNASEPSTDPQTEETNPVQEEEPTETFDLVIDDDGTVYINGQEISKSELVNLLTFYLNEQFGEYLGPMAWILGVIALLAVTFAIILLRRIGVLITVNRSLNNTNNEVVVVGSNVNGNTAAIKQLEARAAKSEALNTVLIEGIYTQMANSKNAAIVAGAVKFKEQADNVLKIDDNIPDALQIVKEAATELGKIVVGETLEKAKKYKDTLVDQINNGG